jgi:hypothetical protein
MGTRKVPWWLSWWLAPGCIAGVLFLFLVVVPVASPDPDLAAVRNLLKDNLPSGKFEEVRWWSARVWPGSVNAYDTWPGHRICRLKYRTDWGRGMSVADQVFVVDEHGIRTMNPVDDNAMVARYWHKCFPNDPE